MIINNQPFITRMFAIPFMHNYRIIRSNYIVGNVIYMCIGICIITDDYEACKIPECAIGVTERYNDKCT